MISFENFEQFSVLVQIFTLSSWVPTSILILPILFFIFLSSSSKTKYSSSMAALILALVESDIGVDSLDETDLTLSAGLGSLEKATGVGSLDVMEGGVSFEATLRGEGSLEKPNGGGGVFLGGNVRGEGSLENPNAGGGGFLSIAGGWNGEVSLGLGVLVPPEGREKEMPADRGGKEEAGGGAAGVATGAGG